MARIPEELLARVKQEIPIQTLAIRKGVDLKGHGDNLIGLCPFHDDRGPSFVVTPGKNLWHCLGACQAGGSVIDFVMRAEGVSFPQAVELLRAEFFPLETKTASARAVKRSTVPQLASPLELDADDRSLMLQVVGYYNDVLKQSPEALAYLEKRGLRSTEVVDHFLLGYANRTLGYRLPAMNRKSGQEVRTRLQRLGVLRESGHEHFNGSLVIPIFSEDGDVLGCYGRKIRDDLRTGTPDHLYLPGPHRGVFNAQGLGKEVILCEALIDALTFWCAGFRNVTASYGVEGFTTDHLDVFKRRGTEHVLIAYDRDEAGDRAAEKLARRLIGEGLSCSRIQFPRGMDTNEYALKVQPAVKSLGLLVRSAEWLGNGRKTLAVEVPVVPEPSPAAKDAPEPEIVAAKEGMIAPVRPDPVAVHELLVREAAATPPANDELDEFLQVLGDRRYRIRGLKKNLGYGVLKLNVFVSRDGDFSSSPIAGFHVDDLNLYSARQRAAFEKQAAHELGVLEDVVKRDLGQILRKAEQLQEESIRKALEPKQKPVVMSEPETTEALELLSDPRLLERILQDFERCGVVGEETNKLVGYLSATSRKLEKPLAVIIQSSSAAGKSSLMEAVLSFMPPEEREQYSALTANSLFYFGEGKSLRHKILAISEEEGAERATYALKLLQSEGQLTIASTGKDATTGRLVTQEYRVEGPVMVFLTTTAIEIDEELLNRCLVLSVDESREQTRRIHDLQRQAETIQGHLAVRRKPRLLKLHQNAQRLLRPLAVHNPFASRLTFLDEKTRTRRDHVKYLSLIRSIALLHQYQRPIREVVEDGEIVEYVDVTLADIEIANRLSAEVLGRSLDELPPQTRRFLLLLDDLVREATERQGIQRPDYRFTSRQVRGFTSWSHDQIRVHLGRLVELEYALVHRGGRGQSFVYELLFDGKGKDGKPFLMGLLDVDALQVVTAGGETAGVGGETPDRGGSMGPQRGGVGVGWVTTLRTAPDAASDSIPISIPGKRHIWGGDSGPSYSRPGRTNGKRVAFNLLKNPPRKRTREADEPLALAAAS